MTTLLIFLIAACGGVQPPQLETQANDLIVVEAEASSANTPQGNRAWTLQDIAGASGGKALQALPDSGKYVDVDYVNRSPSLDFSVNFGEAGTYYLWVRGRAVKGAVKTSDSVHVGLDNKAVPTAERIGGFDAAFGWSNKSTSGKRVTLEVPSAGTHTLNVWMREDGFAVDQLALTRNANYAPKGRDALAPVTREPRILVSRDAARRNGSPLHDQNLSGDVYIHVKGVNHPTLARPYKVQFFIDGTFVKTERAAPYDLQGGGEKANAYDTAQLAEGAHRMRVKVYYRDDSEQGYTWVNTHADFSVVREAASGEGVKAEGPTPPQVMSEMPDLSAKGMLTEGPIAFPEGFMKSVKDYGAVGDGVTDDTAAIQAALDDGREEDKNYFGYPKALYFPAGTYLVSDTLEWRGCCVTMQGQGSGSSVIKLKDRARGFGNSGSPKPVIRTPDGNESFRQNIWDLAVHTGRGNAGAVGIDYIVNNVGSLRNVVVRSGDGRGVSGLDLTRKWPGPLLIKNVAVYGFDIGVHIAHPEYGPTFEYLILENQRVAGIVNEGNTLAIRGLRSRNRVPAVRSTTDRSMVVLLDSQLEGGASASAAIENEGFLYARNVRSSGYGAVLDDRGQKVQQDELSEYLSHQPQSLFGSAKARSLNLPIRETPDFHDDDLDNWAAFIPDSHNDADELQDLLNSGKSTIYFPTGSYMSFRKTVVNVPPTVKKIVGFSSVVNEDGSNPGSGGIRFVVSADAPDPLILEGFGYGVDVVHRSGRTVVLKNGLYRHYESKPGAGDLFLEDVLTYQLRVRPGQNVWARQYNNEIEGTKVINDGGNLWVLGLKTEQAGTVIESRNGARTELLGTLIYPAFPVPSSDVAFLIEDAQASLIYATSVYDEGKGYDVHVKEIRRGDTRSFPAEALLKDRMPLFTGY